MGRRVFIVNPVSGKGRSIEVVKHLEEKCKHDGMDYLTKYTEKASDATKYVQDLTKPNDIIYSIGGDGTLNEIVNGIILFKDRSLCVVPAGSGNDFYKSLGARTSDMIDVGYVNDRLFINSFSIGIDADICDNANLFRKKFIPSSAIYDLSTIYTLMNYKSKNMNIDGVNKDCTLISITNGKYYGGGFKICPSATIDDGFLDMIVVDKMSKKNMVYLLTKLLKGEHEHQNGVTMTKIKNIKIHSSIDLLAGIDGEIFRSSEFNIGIIPQAIKLYEDKELDVKKLLKK